VEEVFPSSLEPVGSILVLPCCESVVDQEEKILIEEAVTA
jgi:hypothetical protein